MFASLHAKGCIGTVTRMERKKSKWKHIMAMTTNTPFLPDESKEICTCNSSLKQQIAQCLIRVNLTLFADLCSTNHAALFIIQHRKPFDYLSYLCRIHPVCSLRSSLLCSLFSLLIYFDARFIRLPQCAYNTNMPVSIGTQHISYPPCFCLIFILSIWVERLADRFFFSFSSILFQFYSVLLWMRTSNSSILNFCSALFLFWLLSLALFQCEVWVVRLFFPSSLLYCSALLIAYTLFICDMWEAPHPKAPKGHKLCCKVLQQAAVQT